MFDTLFTPISVGSVRLKNRIVLPAHGTRLPEARYLRYLEERLRDSVGLLICSNPGIAFYYVGPPPLTPFAQAAEPDFLQPSPGDPVGVRFLQGGAQASTRKVIDLAHRLGVAVFGQLAHGGSYQQHAVGRTGVTASGQPDPLVGEVSHALSRGEIRELVRLYGEAADRGREWGFDGVEVHACHGLMLNSFLSPNTNRRTDEYGGSTENRARFVIEILEEIRRRMPDGYPMGIRMPAAELIAARGASADEMSAVAKLLSPYLDYFSISSGSEGGRLAGVTVPTVPSADFPEAVYASASAVLKHAVEQPVLLTGRVTDPATADRLITGGYADMVGLVRALIADPQWVSKVHDGRIGELRRCTGDNEGCRQRTLFRSANPGFPIWCTVNAAAGREAEMELVPAQQAKHVLVVGGGPAGMEAARVAAARGHKVTLCERSDSLGGQLSIAVKDPRSPDLGDASTYLRHELDRLGVEIRLSTVVTPHNVESMQPDAVIIATGAIPAPLPEPDSAGVSVLHAWDVLSEPDRAGHRVCVVAGFNGYREPATLAELLADRGHAVDIITERAILGEQQDPGSNHYLLKRLFEKNVEIHTFTRLGGISAGAVSLINDLTDQERKLEGINTVVIAAAPRADDALYQALRDTGVQVYPVGDCIAPRRVLHAIYEGSRAGRLA